MSEFTQALQHGPMGAWLFLPTALLLGALHGLEPGHSKTMMAAFIIAIRGTVAQAVLLGLCAAISHSAVIWLLAWGALKFGGKWDAHTSEPWFQLGSAVLIFGMALWMFFRTRRDVHLAHEHGHHHDHSHGHDESHGHGHSHGPGEYQDAHEEAHARDIEKRFAGKPVTTWQIALFGLTGGLMPCPAAFTILLVCLQLREFTLGFALVGAFSVGIALTMVAVGALAAWGVGHAKKHWGGANEILRRAPYFSSALLVLLSLAMAWSAVRALL